MNAPLEISRQALFSRIQLTSLRRLCKSTEKNSKIVKLSLSLPLSLSLSLCMSLSLSLPLSLSLSMSILSRTSYIKSQTREHFHQKNINFFANFRTPQPKVARRARRHLRLPGFGTRGASYRQKSPRPSLANSAFRSAVRRFRGKVDQILASARGGPAGIFVAFSPKLPDLITTV